MKNNTNKFLIIILALLVLILTSAFKLPDASYEFYVYDEVNIINDFTENYIIEVNKELSQKTGAQVVVATVNSLDNMDINSYATALYEKWKIGSKEYDNGLLLLIVPSEGELWIETGYGLEGTLPAGITKRIINDKILPSFSEGNIDDGVILGFEEILNYIEKESEITISSRSLLEENYIPKANANTTTTNNRLPNIFMIIGVILFLFIDFKFFGGWLTISLLRGLGRGRGGGGGGSGGSSGGGGRSGGGGAGGSW